jgi:hypothetical protein
MTRNYKLDISQSHLNSGEERAIFLRDLPVFASLTLHHEVIRVVWHLALAVPSQEPQNQTTIRQSDP